MNCKRGIKDCDQIGCDCNETWRSLAYPPDAADSSPGLLTAGAVGLTLLWMVIR